MTRESRGLRQAIEEEVAEWPGASVTFEAGSGGGHPKARLEFLAEGAEAPLMLRRAYNGNSDANPVAVAATLKDMRRALAQLGAARKEEPTTENDEAAAKRVYHKPVAVQTHLADLVAGERASVKPTVAEQLATVTTGTALAVTAVTPREELPALGPGWHDITEDRYHADPCPEASLSASIAKKMIDKSPYHAWHAHPRLNPAWEPEKDLLTYRIGRAFHSILLGKGAPVEVFDYKDWKKKVARDDRDQALKDGLTPLLPHQHDNIVGMVRAAKRQIGRREELAFAMAGGIPERVYIWEEETPHGIVYCRMMVDWTPHGGRFPIDWKTTATGALAWGERTLWDTQFDIQDAFYRRGFLKTMGVEYDALIAAVIEVDEPNALMHHRVMPESQAAADMEVKWAIRAFAACKAKGRWPGYPIDLAWQEKPGWRAQRTEQRYEGSQRNLEMLDETLRNLEQMKEIPAREGDVEMTDANPFGLPALDGERSAQEDQAQ